MPTNRPTARSSIVATLFSLWMGAVSGLAGCTPATEEPEIAGEVQGTTYHIKFVAPPDSSDPAKLRQQIEQRFAEIDQRLSNYRDDSEISRFNALRTTNWVAVSPEIISLVDISKQVWTKTNGCFDLTVKPLFDLWGFTKHEGRVPSQSEIEQALRHVGMSKVEIDIANSRLRKTDPELGIDLSSIAQGYSVAEVARLLEGSGIQNYLVEIGGELRVKGRKANGRPWRIAIEKPTPFERKVQKVLEIYEQNGTAVMTAGTYRNFFEHGGRVYTHILDPRTGRPITHHLLSVTVLHEDPTWADAWDTALLCVGETEASVIAEQQGLKALLIYQQGSGIREAMSPRFLPGAD